MQSKVQQYYPGFPADINPQLKQIIHELWLRVNTLVEQTQQLQGGGKQVEALSQQVSQTRVAIQAVQDTLTQGSAFVGFGANTATPPDVTSVNLSATGVGFTITGSTSTGIITVTNAATARSAINAAEKESPGVHTITLAPITALGTPGSITWSADGVVSAFVDPT